MAAWGGLWHFWGLGTQEVCELVGSSSPGVASEVGVGRCSGRSLRAAAHALQDAAPHTGTPGRPSIHFF